jgi:secondary thiamine-phosphate synthase enzyme
VSISSSFLIQVNSRSRAEWIDITAQIDAQLARAGIKTGICLIASLHTTSGITLNENADPAVGRDLFWKLAELIPKNDNYRHDEGNSDAHLKASLIGFSATVPVRDGRLLLGTWQAVYFCEFDGPRSRTVNVTIIGE